MSEANVLENSSENPLSEPEVDSMAGKARAKTKELLDEGRTRALEMRDKASESYSKASHAVQENYSKATHAVQDTLEKASKTTPADVCDATGQYVRHNPGKSMLIAGAAGVFLGMLLLRRR